MKNKVRVFILIVIIALTLSAFVGCTPKHAYLIEGTYECQNVSYDSLDIDKITIGVKEITGSDYYKYDPHVIERAEKVYQIDFEIWIDGGQIKGDYNTHYEFDLRYFYLEFIDDNDNVIELNFVTENNDDGNYFLRTNLRKSGVLANEIILNKCN